MLIIMILWLHANYTMILTVPEKCCCWPQRPMNRIYGYHVSLNVSKNVDIRQIPHQIIIAIIQMVVKYHQGEQIHYSLSFRVVTLFHQISVLMGHPSYIFCVCMCVLYIIICGIFAFICILFFTSELNRFKFDRYFLSWQYTQGIFHSNYGFAYYYLRNLLT